MDIKIIYEDSDILVVDKPAGVNTCYEIASSSFDKLRTPRNDEQKTLIDYLIEKQPGLAEVGSRPRYGIVHRLDKDTSGILLVAKTKEALIFLQKKFINRDIEKKYITLVQGVIKQDTGEINTRIGRSPKNGKKQIVYLEGDNGYESQREAVTVYKVLQRFADYTLLEVQIKTGRKHQIRCHVAYIQHPVAGDKMYGFKNSKNPKGLVRQFLHASYMKVQMPSGRTKEFISELPEDLKQVFEKLKIIN